MAFATCNAPVCARGTGIKDRFCSHHKITRRTQEGTRVVFDPSHVSAMLYSHAPPRGAVGTVTTCALPGGRATYLPGPGGGLLYVMWDNIGTCGVAPADCRKVG